MRIIPVILVCLAAAIPALASPALFYPAAWSQAVVFRFVVSLFLAFSIFAIAQRKKEVLEKLRGAKSVLIPLGAFVSVLFLALVFSQDRYMSFWNLPLRGWGLLNYFALVLFAFLAFLFLRREDWKWVWASALGTGVFVTLVALAQQQGLLRGLLAEYTPRPPSTLGNPIFLGIYLLLLCLLTLSFAVFKQGKLRVMLFGLALFFALGIFITLSRAAFIGLGTGILFLLLFHPKSSAKLKIGGIAFVFLFAATISLINIAPNPSPESPLLSGLWQRFQLTNLLDAPRILGWQMQLRGVAESPILGYGPYNTHIPFNKEYTPLFAQITHSSGYWDTSHNEFLDILVGSGILGLGAYLVFLAALWMHLEKAKRRQPENAMLFHGIQAILIGYHTALFFFPNTFATSLIFFILLAFCLHISVEQQTLIHADRKPIYTDPHKSAKSVLIGVLAIALLFFNWQLNLKPLFLNREINVAENNAASQKCELSLSQSENILKQGTFLNYYANLTYVDLISKCIGSMPNQTNELSQKAVHALEQEVRVRPTEPRTWILLGGYTNNLAALEKDPAKKTELIANARNSFKQAFALSPNRPELFPEWARTELIAEDYNAARQKIEQCLSLNKENGSCWFQQAIVSAKLGDVPRSLQELARFKSLGGRYKDQGHARVLQIVQALLATKEKPHAELAELYVALTEIQPKNPQYFASLAATYREMGNYGLARNAAKEVLRLQPENRGAVEQFLLTLPPEYR